MSEELISKVRELRQEVKAADRARQKVLAIKMFYPTA